MRLSRGVRYPLIALVIIALICVAVVAAAPLAARELTLHYLDGAGVDASIGNVDVNLFTGTIEYNDIEGHTQAGDGFKIGRLAANITYPPLLSKQISLSHLGLEDARIDVRRTADNALRVGGITVFSPDAARTGSTDWGLALGELTVGGLRIHYSQPAQGDSPAIDHEIVFSQSSAHDVVTWQQDNNVPVDAAFSVGDSQLAFKGHITPFGRNVNAHFELKTRKFALDLLAPITRSGGLKSLTGTLDSDQEIDLRYTADSGLAITLDGKAHWQDSRLALASGPTLASDAFDWKGTLKLHLLRSGSRGEKNSSDHRTSAGTNDTARVVKVDDMTLEWAGAAPLANAESTLAMVGTLPLARTDDLAAGARGDQNDTLDVDGQLTTKGFVGDWPDHFHVSQKSLDWQGTLQMNRAGASKRVTTDSSLTLDALEYSAAGGMKISAGHLDWQGSTTTAVADATRVDSKGELQTRDIRLATSGGTTLAGADLKFKGQTRTQIAGAGTDIRTNGKLDAGGLNVATAQGTTVNSGALTFDGTTHTATGTNATRIDSDGDLSTRALAVAVPNSIDFDTDTLDFKGTSGTRVGASTTHVDTDGNLDATALKFAVAKTSTFTASDVGWQGTTAVDSGQLFAQKASGRLVAAGARLDIDSGALAFSADRAAYDGDYAQTPGAAGKTLVLTMSGAIDGHQFRVMNTAINAPWLDVIQLYGGGLTIDGLDSIALNTIKAKGVRVLGDTDSNAAVLESVNTSANNFRLDDLLHYRVAKIDIQGANIHVRRDKNGLGVIGEYFGGGKSKDASTSGSTSSGPPATYAMDDLALTGPSVMFTDTTVEPNVVIDGADLNLGIEDLDTARPDRDANFRLSLDVGAYGHFDSRGKIAPLASDGVNMDLDAWLRSLALEPLSGYLNSALGRRIANGVADGTLHMGAKDGQLDGNLDTTLANFRLVKAPKQHTSVALGISLDTALALVRGRSDNIKFRTLILGDATNPYFSVKNLVREAVLAGLRTAILSDYSPLGLINKAKNALLDLGRSLVSKPVGFEPGKHYVRPEDRPYLGRIAQAMTDKPGLRLTVKANAVPGDADAMSMFHGASVDEDNVVSLQNLAKQRGEAVRDYLAARGVNPDRITVDQPAVDRDNKAKAQATFSIQGR